MLIVDAPAALRSLPDAASEPFVALLPAGVDAAALDGLVRLLQREPSMGAVGLGSENLVDVLALPAGPCVVRRAALEAAGPAADLFDERPAMGRLDLGWRLRAAGWRVCTRGAAAPPAEPPADDALTAGLLLAVLHRNLGDAAADALLGPALAATRRLPGIGAEAGAAYERLVPHLGRGAVQGRRRRGDVEVLPYVREADVFPSGTRALADGEAARLLDGRHRVLVLTLDLVGPRMAGPAIRAWELAHALAAEHEVTLAANWDGAVTSPAVRLLDLGNPNLRIEAARQDIVVVQGWALVDHPWIAGLPVVLIADLYDPVHLETLEVERERPVEDRRRGVRAATDVLMTQIRRGDFFLCASRRQRDLWLGHLAAAGRVNPDTYDGDESLQRFVAEVPFGVSRTPPIGEPGAIKGVVPGIGADDEVILWGGGIYNWFDPLTLIRAVHRLHAERPQVRLFFLGTRHPNPAVPEMAMTASAMALAEELGLRDSVVFFNEGWVPYEERARWFCDADLGVSCHYEHLETAFAFRTRMLDYLWAGLPVVATDGDVFADLIRTRELGAVVAPEDADGLASALRDLLADPVRLAACRENVRDVADELGWDRLVRPLVEFCRRPRPAADLTVPGPAPATSTRPRTGLGPAVRGLARRVRAR